MISLAVMLAWLEMTAGDDPEAEGILTDLIDAATAGLGRELARYIGLPAEVVEIHQGGTYLVLLNDDPTEGETVAVETRAGPTSAWDLEVEGVEQDFVQEGRALRHGSTWPTGPNVRATYTHGYDVDTGPAELRDLVREAVAAIFQGRSENAAMQSETIGDYSYTRADFEKLTSWRAAQRWRRGLI